MKSELTLNIIERILFAEGDAFGETGTYERIKGRVCYAVDPQEEAFSRITDLDKAPTNEKGLVEYSTDFLILKPQNPKKGNRRLFFDWGNRGNSVVSSFSMTPWPAMIQKPGNMLETDFCSVEATPLYLQVGREICWQEMGDS